MDKWQQRAAEMQWANLAPEYQAMNDRIEAGPVSIVQNAPAPDASSVMPIYWPDYRPGMYVDGSADEDIWRHVRGEDYANGSFGPRNGDWQGMRGYSDHWRKKQADLAKPRAVSPTQQARDLLENGDPQKTIEDWEHFRLWGKPPPSPPKMPSDHERAVADFKRRHAQRLAALLGPPRRR